MLCIAGLVSMLIIDVSLEVATACNSYAKTKLLPFTIHSYGCNGLKI